MSGIKRIVICQLLVKRFHHAVAPVHFHIMNSLHHHHMPGLVSQPANPAVERSRQRFCHLAGNIGSMFRNGWENNVKSIDALPYVEAGSNARTSDISSGEYAVMPLAPMKESDAPNEELRQAWEYYHTPRAQYPAEFGIELTAIGELVPARGGRAMVEIR